MRIVFAVVLCVGMSGCEQLTAQQGPQHAADGGTRERMESVAILPLAGASFSATVVTEWTRVLPDGSKATVRNQRRVARDSSGRVFQERRYLTPNGDVVPSQVSALEYQDPIRHEWFVCEPARRLCQIYKLDRPAQRPVLKAGPLPAGRGSVTLEALGERTQDNLDLVGSREIATLNAGVVGNERPEPTVKEFWYSPRLELNVVTKRFDPHASAIQDIEVTKVNLNEPDSRLFLPPADYRVIRMDAE